MDYLEVNKQLWNNKTEVHYKSDFYDNNSFVNGRNSLNQIELNLLGSIKDKKILHLQCHFGQDTISLNRLGAISTGVDFSKKAIEKARQLAKKTNSSSNFICCDIYSLDKHLNEEFDIVFTSYGTIAWLPDLNQWADIISKFLKPNGKFIMAEFHPFVWMYDNNFKQIEYSYFNREPIIELSSGTYANTNSDLEDKEISWNHPISDVVNSLISKGMEINSINEFDYSPYNCFENMNEFEKGKFQINGLQGNIPMTYSIEATK